MLATIKYILQKAWLLNLDWDATMPVDFCEEIQKFVDSFLSCGPTKLPRFMDCASPNVSLHCFGDASPQMLCAVLYVKTPNEGYMFVRAKSKVVPKKSNVTLPKLELCAAVMASELIEWGVNIFGSHVGKYVYSDSMISISWIASSPEKWKAYIANRVRKVHNKLGCRNVRYVPSEMNPADIPTRCCDSVEPENWKNWLHPAFVFSDSTTESVKVCHAVEDMEVASETDILLDLSRYNSCLLYTSPSPRDRQKSRMPSSA